MNKKIVTLTISEKTDGFDVKCKAFNCYTQFDIKKSDLFSIMRELSDFFDNVLNFHAVFEIE